MARNFWTGAIQEADQSVHGFLDSALALSLASPHLCAWRVVEHLEEEIDTFVRRAAGAGSGDFSQEAAGNFVLLLEAVEDYRRQTLELQDTLEKLAAEDLARGRPRAQRRGTRDAGVHRKAHEKSFSPTVALAVANATVPSARGDQTPGGGCGLPVPVVQRPSSVVGAFGAVISPRAA